MDTQEYKDYVQWNHYNGIHLQMTNSQMRYTEYVLNNKELCKMLEQPGDLLTCTIAIQRYLKRQ